MDIKQSSERCNALVSTCLTGIASHLQSAGELQKKIHEAAVACAAHAKEHGDVMPMDRLIKGIPDDHSVVMFRFELLAWCREFTSIRWNAKGEVRQAKPDEAGYTPYALEEAEKTPFFERPAAITSRKAATAAAQRELQPATFQNALNRVFGLRKWLNGLEVASETTGQVRGIKSEDKDKIVKLFDTIEAAVKAEFGVENPAKGVAAHGTTEEQGKKLTEAA